MDNMGMPTMPAMPQGPAGPPMMSQGPMEPSGGMAPPAARSVLAMMERMMPLQQQMQIPRPQADPMQGVVSMVMQLALDDDAGKIPELLEDQMQMPRKAISQIYEKVIRQYDMMRPRGRPSISGMMEVYHGKTKDTSAGDNTAKSAARTYEPGDITAEAGFGGILDGPLGGVGATSPI